MVDISTFFAKASTSSVGGSISYLFMIISGFLILGFFLYILSKLFPSSDLLLKLSNILLFIIKLPIIPFIKLFSWSKIKKEKKIEKQTGMNKEESEDEHLITSEENNENNLDKLNSNIKHEKKHSNEKDKLVLDSLEELDKAEITSNKLDESDHLMLSKIIGLISGIRNIELSIHNYVKHQNLKKLTGDLNDSSSELKSVTSQFKKIISKFKSEEHHGLVHYQNQIKDLKKSGKLIHKKRKKLDPNSNEFKSLSSELNTLKHSFELLTRLNARVGNQFQKLSSELNKNKLRLNELIDIDEKIKSLIKQLKKSKDIKVFYDILINLTNNIIPSYYALIKLMLTSNYYLCLILYSVDESNKENIKLESNLQTNEHIKTYSQQLFNNSNTMESNLDHTKTLIHSLYIKVRSFKNSLTSLKSELETMRDNKVAQQSQTNNNNNKGINFNQPQFQS